MGMFGAVLTDWLTGKTWEQGRGLIAQELAQLRGALTTKYGANFGTDNTLKPGAIGATPTDVPAYVGTDVVSGALSFLKIDLVTGVKKILAVVNGGLGVASLAAHTVVIGAGTNPVATAGPGATGDVLTSNGASADPTFQPTASGDALTLAWLGL